MIKALLNYHEYSGSDDGKIYRHKNGTLIEIKGYIFANERVVKLTKKKTMVNVKRLIAEAFIPNPLKLEYVKHVNGDKSDNRVENLVWCDAKGQTNPTVMHIDVDRNGAKWFIPKSEFRYGKNIQVKASHETIDEAEYTKHRRPTGMQMAVDMLTSRDKRRTEEDVEDAYGQAMLDLWIKAVETGRPATSQQLHSRTKTNVMRGNLKRFDELNQLISMSKANHTRNMNDDDSNDDRIENYNDNISDYEGGEYE